MDIPRIKDLRVDNDLTQAQIASELNIAQRTYSGYETGTREVPISTLIKLAEFYGVSVDYLLGLTNNPERNR